MLKRGIGRQFLGYYLFVILLSLLAGLAAYGMLSLANGMLAGNLLKDRYPASAYLESSPEEIDAREIVENGGGLQVVGSDYSIRYSAGLNPLDPTDLNAASFTRFLMNSGNTGYSYHHDIAYNEQEDTWLIVTFPTSIRLDFALVYNRTAALRDLRPVGLSLVFVVLAYLLILALMALFFVRKASREFTDPLAALTEGTRKMRDGDYAIRVHLNLKNEFGELQDTFNQMAQRIGEETLMRKQLEDDRRQMILDLSHDLKNPLACVAGYADLCLEKPDLPVSERMNYLRIIRSNSRRAADLLGGLFELSRMEAPGFELKLIPEDLTEILREILSRILPELEQAGFGYRFSIPETPVYARLDAFQFGRVIHNLAENSIRYNGPGTSIRVEVWQEVNRILVRFGDDGTGIPPEMAEKVFRPFARLDPARSSSTGGSGLGLSIARKIILAHGGELHLEESGSGGCTFLISLPGAFPGEDNEPQ